MSTEIRGLDIVVEGLEQASNAIRVAAFEGVIEGLEMAHEHSREIISARDHSLKDLAAMGHPYSAAHGFQIHDPDETVHEQQSGQYLSALTVEKPSYYAGGEIIEGAVHIAGDAEMEDRDRWIQEGTTRMRARNWSQRVVDEHGQEIADHIEARIEGAVQNEGAA